MTHTFLLFTFPTEIYILPLVNDSVHQLELTEWWPSNSVLANDTVALRMGGTDQHEIGDGDFSMASCLPFVLLKPEHCQLKRNLLLRHENFARDFTLESVAETTTRHGATSRRRDWFGLFDVLLLSSPFPIWQRWSSAQKFSSVSCWVIINKVWLVTCNLNHRYVVSLSDYL